MTSTKSSLLLVSLLTSSLAYAVGEQGTGENIQIIVDENDRVILQAQQGDLQTIGSNYSDNGYTVMELDAMSEDGMLPNWGAAEVALDCYSASVILYQRQGEALQEYSAHELVTDHCPRQE